MMNLIIILSIVIGGILYTVLNDDTVDIKDVPVYIKGFPKVIGNLFHIVKGE